VAYVQSGKRGAWRAHGVYLAREGAQREGAKGLGFDARREDLEVARTLGAWQEAGDRVLWKAIVSPEQSAALDLRAHTRALVAQMERDLGTRLEWVGIDHHNTDHPHVHLLIRGRDARGRALTLDAAYVQRGIRARSEDLATRRLGLRTDRDIAASREQAVTRAHFTELDRAILARADGDRRLEYGDRPLADRVERTQRQLEIRRLDFLGTLGLAERVAPGTWELSPQLEATLRQIQLAGDIQKSRGRHRAHLSGRQMPPVALLTLATIQREQGRPIRVLEPLDGLLYRGQLLGYTRDDHGQHYAVVDTGRELSAFRTEERGLAIGREVRVTGHRVASGPSAHTWRLRGAEQERERAR
jgi:type IV secretory pathway VirD2 relaxase